MEIWKDIKGFEGLYKISNHGNVYSIRRKKILKPSNSGDKDWYLHVTLYNHQIAKTFFVHRLVAFAFLPNPNNYMLVNHKSGVKSNPHVDNLEWNTDSMNIKHAYNIGLFEAPISKKIHQINKDTKEIINTFKSCAEATRFLNKNLESKSNINACARGERKSAFGYKWKFA